MCYIHNAFLIYSKETNHTDTTKLPMCGLQTGTSNTSKCTTTLYSSLMADFGKNGKWKMLIKKTA